MIQKKEDFIHSCLGLASAQICLSLGWHSIHKSSHNILNDVLERYLLLVTQTAAKYSEKFSRTIPNIEDVTLAFDQLGIEITELEDYVQQVEQSPVINPPPKINKETNNQLVFDGDSQFPPIVKVIPPEFKTEPEPEKDTDGNAAKVNEANEAEIKPLVQPVDIVLPVTSSPSLVTHFERNEFAHSSHEAVDSTRPGLKVMTPKGYTPKFPPLDKTSSKKVAIKEEIVEPPENNKSGAKPAQFLTSLSAKVVVTDITTLLPIKTKHSPDNSTSSSNISLPIKRSPVKISLTAESPPMVTSSIKSSLIDTSFTKLPQEETLKEIPKIAITPSKVILSDIKHKLDIKSPNGNEKEMENKTVKCAPINNSKPIKPTIKPVSKTSKKLALNLSDISNLKRKSLEPSDSKAVKPLDSKNIKISVAKTVEPSVAIEVDPVIGKIVEPPVAKRILPLVTKKSMSIKDVLIKKEVSNSPPQLIPSPQVLLSPQLLKNNLKSPIFSTPAAIIRGEAINPSTPTRKIIFPKDIKPCVSPPITSSKSSPITESSPKDLHTLTLSPPRLSVAPDRQLSTSEDTDDHNLLFSPIPTEMPVLVMEKHAEEVFDQRMSDELNNTGNSTEQEVDIISLSKEEKDIKNEIDSPTVTHSNIVFNCGDEKKKKKKKKSDKLKSEHRKEKKEKKKKREDKSTSHIPIPKLTLKMGNETISESIDPNIYMQSKEVVVPPLFTPLSPPLPKPVTIKKPKKQKENKPTAGFYAETITSVPAADVYYCPGCSRPDDGSAMIGCDSCDEWYHWLCVNIHVAPAVDSQWFCPKCRSGPPPKKKKKRKKREN